MASSRLSKLSLQQLLVLQSLLRTGSASKAGDELGMTQANVSHHLKRLRQALGDPLFLTQRGGWEPTEFAMALAEPLSLALRQLEVALSPAPVVGSAAPPLRVGVHGGLAEYLSAHLVSHLAGLAAQTGGRNDAEDASGEELPTGAKGEANPVQLARLQVVDAPQARRDLGDESLDVAIGPWREDLGAVRGLTSWPWVWITSAGDPAKPGEKLHERLQVWMGPLAREQQAAPPATAPQLEVSSVAMGAEVVAHGSGAMLLPEPIARHFLARTRIAVTEPSPLPAPFEIRVFAAPWRRYDPAVLLACKLVERVFGAGLLGWQ